MGLFEPHDRTGPTYGPTHDVIYGVYFPRSEHNLQEVAVSLESLKIFAGRTRYQTLGYAITLKTSQVNF